jgi:hypothetical protein
MTTATWKQYFDAGCQDKREAQRHLPALRRGTDRTPEGKECEEECLMCRAAQLQVNGIG